MNEKYTNNMLQAVSKKEHRQSVLKNKIVYKLTWGYKVKEADFEGKRQGNKKMCRRCRQKQKSEQSRTHREGGEI